MGRNTLQGFPAAITPLGMSFVTTAPDPMTTLLPMVTPGLMTTLPHTHTLSPMVMGLAMPNLVAEVTVP